MKSTECHLLKFRILDLVTNEVVLELKLKSRNKANNILSNLEEEQLTKIHKLYVQSHNRYYYYYGYQQTMTTPPSPWSQSYPLLIEETGYFRPLDPLRP